VSNERDDQLNLSEQSIESYYIYKDRIITFYDALQLVSKENVKNTIYKFTPNKKGRKLLSEKLNSYTLDELRVHGVIGSFEKVHVDLKCDRFYPMKFTHASKVYHEVLITEKGEKSRFEGERNESWVVYNSIRRIGFPYHVKNYEKHDHEWVETTVSYDVYDEDNKHIISVGQVPHDGLLLFTSTRSCDWSEANFFLFKKRMHVFFNIEYTEESLKNVLTDESIIDYFSGFFGIWGHH